MASRKRIRAPGGGGGQGQPAMSAKLRRHYKAKARRERQLRAKPPGFKERFIAGCFFFGILGAIVLLTALTWSCLHREA